MIGIGGSYLGARCAIEALSHGFVRKAGVPHFRLHALRHFFASYLHDKGYSDKQIQSLGGWSTDSVLKSIYQHAMDMDAAKARASEDISKIIL